MAKLLPTTKTQVSGHRFMRRRVEHGIVFGDVRMIHDPLSSRRRAMVFGMVAVLLVSGVMGLFAWMRPNPDPGEAPILRASDGSLFVQVDGVAHPVTNLASARLIAGSAAQPARVGEQALGQLRKGVPVGIVSAPAVFAPADSEDEFWSVCQAGTDVVVRADQAPEALLPSEAVLAVADNREWVVTAAGRTQLPPPTTPEGRIIRRGLGVSATTPRWSPPPALITALKELPPYALPHPLPQIVRTPAGSWLLVNGAVQPITRIQELLLIDAGANPTHITQPQLASYPDLEPAFDLRLPEQIPMWVDPARRAVCVDEVGGAGAVSYEEALRGAVQLSGTAVATHFAGLHSGSVGVDSGFGFHVVSANGLRHAAVEALTLETVGVARIDTVPWGLLALLPEGEALTREAALTATY